MNHNYFSLTREELGRRILTVNTLNPPLRCAFLYKTNAHRLIPRSVVFFVHKDCSSKRKYASEKLQRPQVCVKGQEENVQDLPDFLVQVGCVFRGGGWCKYLIIPCCVSFITGLNDAYGNILTCSNSSHVIARDMCVARIEVMDL